MNAATEEKERPGNQTVFVCSIETFLFIKSVAFIFLARFRVNSQIEIFVVP